MVFIKMSRSSSLSPAMSLPPLSPMMSPPPPPLLSLDEEPQLPPLRLVPPPSVQLPFSNSILFTKNLYSRVILDLSPPKIQYTCLQPNCEYIAPLQSISYTTTTNLWT